MHEYELVTACKGQGGAKGVHTLKFGDSGHVTPSIRCIKILECGQEWVDCSWYKAYNRMKRAN
jgi:hypothetical protein